MALVYIFVANIGAQADVSGLNASAGWFILACYIWIFIHGFFCLLGAYILKVDIHSTAIASAANIGGAASAPVVASHHNEKLVPVSILMALMGYAVGDGCKFLKTSDGGLNWISKTLIIGSSITLNCVEFINPNVGWVGYGTDKYSANISKTTDGGESWTLSSFAPVSIIGWPVPGQAVYVMYEPLEPEVVSYTCSA